MCFKKSGVYMCFKEFDKNLKVHMCFLKADMYVFEEGHVCFLRQTCMFLKADMYVLNCAYAYYIVHMYYPSYCD